MKLRIIREDVVLCEFTYEDLIQSKQGIWSSKQQACTDWEKQAFNDLNNIYNRKLSCKIIHTPTGYDFWYSKNFTPLADFADPEHVSKMITHYQLSKKIDTLLDTLDK